MTLWITWRHWSLNGSLRACSGAFQAIRWRVSQPSILCGTPHNKTLRQIPWKCSRLWELDAVCGPELYQTHPGTWKYNEFSIILKQATGKTDGNYARALVRQYFPPKFRVSTLNQDSV
jgi:hypothetical protein